MHFMVPLVGLGWTVGALANGIHSCTLAMLFYVGDMYKLRCYPSILYTAVIANSIPMHFPLSPAVALWCGRRTPLPLKCAQFPRPFTHTDINPHRHSRRGLWLFTRHLPTDITKRKHGCSRRLDEHGGTTEQNFPSGCIWRFECILQEPLQVCVWRFTWWKPVYGYVWDWNLENSQLYHLSADMISFGWVLYIKSSCHFATAMEVLVARAAVLVVYLWPHWLKCWAQFLFHGMGVKEPNK